MATENHGRVRIKPDHEMDGSDGMGITLADTEHCMSVDEALALANRIIFTAVDRQTRLPSGDQAEAEERRASIRRGSRLTDHRFRL